MSETSDGRDTPDVGVSRRLPPRGSTPVMAWDQQINVDSGDTHDIGKLCYRKYVHVTCMIWSMRPKLPSMKYEVKNKEIQENRQHKNV